MRLLLGCLLGANVLSAQTDSMPMSTAVPLVGTYSPPLPAKIPVVRTMPVEAAQQFEIYQLRAALLEREAKELQARADALAAEVCKPLEVKACAIDWMKRTIAERPRTEDAKAKK